MKELLQGLLARIDRGFDAEGDPALIERAKEVSSRPEGAVAPYRECMGCAETKICYGGPSCINKTPADTETAPADISMCDHVYHAVPIGRRNSGASPCKGVCAKCGHEPSPFAPPAAAEGVPAKSIVIDHDLWPEIPKGTKLFYLPPEIVLREDYEKEKISRQNAQMDLEKERNNRNRKGIFLEKAMSGVLSEDDKDPRHAQVAEMAIELTRLRSQAGAMPEKLVNAMRCWWEDRRPVAWIEEDHFANPSINTKTASEHALAVQIAKYLSAPPAAAEGVPDSGLLHTALVKLAASDRKDDINYQAALIKGMFSSLQATIRELRQQAIRTQSSAHSEHSLAMVGAQAGAVPHGWLDGEIVGGDSNHNTVTICVDGPIPKELWTMGLRARIAAPIVDANKGGVPEGASEWRQLAEAIATERLDTDGYCMLCAHPKGHEPSCPTSLAVSLLAAPAAPVAADERVRELESIKNKAARFAALLWDRFKVCPECGHSDGHMPSCNKTYEAAFRSPRDFMTAFDAALTSRKADGKGGEQL